MNRRYDNDIFITIDIDWASDEVLTYAINLLERYEIRATFFVTHDTPVLERLRSNPLFELGIHPNFQKILNGNVLDGAMETVYSDILSIVPDAVSVRSHSLVQSSPLLDLFARKGQKYDVNLCIPWENLVTLKPIRHWNGLLRVPYCWEDDVQCIQAQNGSMDGWNAEILLGIKGLKVFNFHPIHLFLNTESLERYEQARPFLRECNLLAEYRNDTNRIGAEAVLMDIINLAQRSGFSFRNIKDIGELV